LVFVVLGFTMKNLILLCCYCIIGQKQVRHPSALDMFPQIIDAAKGKQIVMFLDYDGTLSPIVDDPDRAFMSRPVSPSFLASVHHNFIDITFFSLYQLLNFVSFR
jgi:hypothetical protein